MDPVKDREWKEQETGTSNTHKSAVCWQMDKQTWTNRFGKSHLDNEVKNKGCSLNVRTTVIAVCNHVEIHYGSMWMWCNRTSISYQILQVMFKRVALLNLHPVVPCGDCCQTHSLWILLSIRTRISISPNPLFSSDISSLKSYLQCVIVLRSYQVSLASRAPREQESPLRGLP